MAAKKKSGKSSKSKKNAEPKVNSKKASGPKKAPAKKEGKAKPKPKAEPRQKPKNEPTKARPEPKKEPTMKELRRTLEHLGKKNEKLEQELRDLRALSREQNKQIASLEGKMGTRVKREEIWMKALDFNTRTKKGERGAIGDLNSSILKADEHLLKMNKRLENILSAIKNHREYLIRLNKRVYKEDPLKIIEMDLDIMSNTLNIMALSGFSIDKGLFNDVKKIRKMMDKKDVEISKLRKRMNTFERKFDEEMERFDFESIYKKAEHIPGYR